MTYAIRLIDQSTTPDTALTVQQIIAAAVDAVPGEEYTTAEKSKLAGIEAGATAAQTGAEIVGLVDAQLGNSDWQSPPISMEQLQDAVAAMLQAGTHTNLTVTYDDGAGTISLAATGGGGGLDQEQAEDIVASLVDVAGGGISVTYDDGAGTLTFALTGESYTTAEKSKLAGIEAGATADQTAAEIAFAYGTIHGKVSGGEITAGTETNLRTYSPADIVAMIGAHGPAAGADGEDGVGIADVEIDGSGHLIVTLTDLSTIDAGALPTAGSEYGGGDCCSPWPIPAGMYFTGPYPSGGGYNFPAGNLRLMPLRVESLSTWNRIGLLSSTGAGRTVRVGIYTTGTDGYPAELLVEGTMASAATEIEATIADTELAPGLYWLAHEVDAVYVQSTYRAFSVNDAPWSLTGSSPPMQGLQLNRSYAALPADLSGSSYLNPSYVPRLWLRYVS